jgi:hypothetical protein
MRTYYRFAQGLTPVGAIVIHLYRSGDEIRGFIRQIAEDEEDDSVYPSEELEPDAAFRLADNKRDSPSQPVYVELSEGVKWNPDWGTLS